MLETEIVSILRNPSHGRSGKDVEQHPLIGGTPGETPILRWAGSKKRLLSHLIAAARVASADRYIEPFMGSGSVFLKLNPAKAILSDINPHLITAYKGVRDNPERVWSLVMSWPGDDAFYYQLRKLPDELLTDIEQAARFLYLNRYCFNGVYRTNLQGRFNVARGQGNLGIPSWEIIREFAAKLRDVTLSQCDFAVSIDQAKYGDLVYVDPPYLAEGKRDRGEYGAGVFGHADLNRLLDSLNRANQRGAKIIMSYTPCDIVLKALDNWHTSHVSVARNISSNTATRITTREIIISNYEWEDVPGDKTCSACDLK
jgi:DNA adenine methylase